MDELTPLIPEKKLTELIEKKMRELGVSQHNLEDELDIAQPLLSRSLRFTREFKYSEAQKIIEYLLLKRSLIPYNLKAIDYATTGDDLAFAYDDESISELVAKMKGPGFSQIPIKSKANGNWIGVVTDLGIVKMLQASSREVIIKDRTKIGSMLIRDSGLIEGIVDCPDDESLIVVAQMLIHFYAILLRSDLGEVRGIITRADLLKLIVN
jgi:predicted transcriptional regulator